MDRGPALALARMVAATRPGGLVVALEYSHADLVWEPVPPATRRASTRVPRLARGNGWDNRLAHRCRALRGAGLDDAETSVEDEVAVRGEPGFGDALAIWRRVMADMGPRVVEAGALAAGELAEALGAHGALERSATPAPAHGAAGRRRPPGRPRENKWIRYPVGTGELGLY